MALGKASLAASAAALLLAAALQGGPSVAVFVGLELLLLPVTLSGVGVCAGAVFRQLGRTGTSATAMAPLLIRYALDEYTERKDPAGRAIVDQFVPYAALLAAARPTEFAARAAGLSDDWVAGLFGSSHLLHQMAKRTFLMDAALEAHLASVEQLVVLGAGFDTRGVSPEVERQGVKVFEVDTSRTQPMKRGLYESSGSNSSKVTFVEVDFNKEHWLSKLEASGFDCSRPTYFHWEGVSYYLPREVVAATLRDMSRCGSGSVVALDYFSREVVQGTGLAENVLLKRVVTRLGEPFDFGLEMSPPARRHAAEWVADIGLQLEEVATMRPERAGKSQFSGVLIASVP